MVIEEHALLKEAESDVVIWARHRSNVLWIVPEDIERISQELSPRQRYEYTTLCWCETLVLTFGRLRSIRDMMGRHLHKRKREDRSTLLEDWAAYNYGLYTLVYQSVLDIGLLLANEAFDLGIPYRTCFFDTVVKNRRVKGTHTERALKEIQSVSKKHRQGKNLLLHRGQPVPIPRMRPVLGEEAIGRLAVETGMETERVKLLLREFLARSDVKQLTLLIDKECAELEARVDRLFNALLPHYRTMRGLYTD